MTRRGLLERAVWIFPATAFLARWVGAAHEVSPVMAKLSTYMAEARKSELPEKVVQDTKHHILDTVAASVLAVGLLLANSLGLDLRRIPDRHLDTQLCQ